jgi:hypothetical protein
MRARRILLALPAIVLIFSLLFPIGAQAAIDDSYSKALLHFNGADQSTTFTDESGKTWTPYGSPVIATAQSKFGGASLRLNGSSTVYINYGPDFDLSSGDFTIEAWVRLDAFDVPQMIFAKDLYGIWLDYQFYIASATSIGFKSNNGNSSVVATVPTMSINTWYHLAAVMHTGTLNIYLNGTSYGSGSPAMGNHNELYVRIGDSGCDCSFMTGYIDELRISKTARWTNDFTPPTSEYTDGITGTPTQTLTPSNTFTPTHTGTPTQTFTPTNTNTLAPFFQTRTPTQTGTATFTPSATSGSSATPTPSPTITPTPGAVIWAAPNKVIDGDMQTAIATLLQATPPDGWNGNVYAVMDSATQADSSVSVSLVNLVGVSSPYTEWYLEDNAAWFGVVSCSLVEASWACAYPVPLAMGNNAVALGSVLPWAPGTEAQYGVSGIHSGTTSWPGSVAVDLFGSDTHTNSMPAMGYAAEAGTVTATCPGTYNKAILVEGARKLAYFHLVPGVAWKDGDKISTGQQLGTLARGNFDERCGRAWQANSEYHVHFVFIPSGSTFDVGPCSLDLSLQTWNCGGRTYAKLAWIPNGGNNAPVPTSTVCPGCATSTPLPAPVPTGSGAHIWDGIVAGVIDIISSIGKILPKHTDWGLYEYVDKIYTNLMDFAWLVAASQIVLIAPAVACYSIILVLEVIRFVLVMYRWLVSLEPIA